MSSYVSAATDYAASFPATQVALKVTDTGLRMMLGLDGPVKTKICSSLEKIIIKDTSITDDGAFSLLSSCPSLYSLEFSHGTFIKQFLDRIEDNYAKTGSTFPLFERQENLQCSP